MSRPGILAFVHVAKTAGRTVETMLRSTYGAGYIHAEPPRERGTAGDASGPFTVPKFDVEDFRRLKRICPWMRCVGGHAVALWSGLEQVQPTRWFAFLRDPVARGASHFQFHRQTDPRPLDWDDWVRWEVHHNHQVKMFSRDCNVDEAIEQIERLGVFVGLMEHFDESLVLLQRLLAPELRIGYERTNTATDRSIARDLLADPLKREQLAEMYALDRVLYDHVAGTLYPRWREEYGPGLEEAAARLADGASADLNRTNLIAHRLVRRYWIEPWSRRFRSRG